MAKTGNIDPAMQAAPYLGDSSHDPIEFVRRQNTIKYQRSKEKQAEIEKNTAKGLDKLMIDLDGWNDKQGFKEVITRQQKAKDMYMELATKGVNFVNPTTEGEVMAYKALTDYQAKTKEVADLRNSQKVKMDVINKLKIAEQAKGKDDQTVDWDATEANLLKALNDNSIAGRDEILNNALVVKPQLGDVQKFITSIKDRITKPTTKSWQSADENGIMQTYTSDVTDAKTEAEIYKDLRNQYKYAPENIKNYIKEQGRINKGNEPTGFSDEDRFIAIARPAYKEKFTQKAAGSGGGLNFNFLGSKANVTPGERQDNERKLGDRTYGERYELDSKPIYNKVPTAGGMMQDEDNKWNPITVDEYAEANLMFYDPTRDELVFRSTTSTQNMPANTSFAIPRKKLKEAEAYPIRLPDGKMGTLKDVMPKPESFGVLRKNVNNPVTWVVPKPKK